MTHIHEHVAAFSALPADTLALLAPIETEEAYSAALEATEILSDLMMDGEQPALVGIFQTLVDRIAAYEEAAYPLPEVAPHDMLAYIMEKQELRQSELAERLGVTQATISRLVSGQTKFTTQWIAKLSKALGVDGAVFIGR